MIIRNASRSDLAAALETVTLLFNGNIIWNREPEPLNKSGMDWRLTLRCISSKEAGHGVSRMYSTRNLVSACWHVHGYFFDALPDRAVIIARGRRIVPHSPWEDYNVGSAMYPVMASESCTCGQEEDNNGS